MEKSIYQDIIDKLCDKYDIPSIPVRIVSVGSLGSVQAYFDNIEYYIAVEPDTGAEHVIHEWTHYCIHLISRVNELEEALCNLMPVGVLEAVEDTKLGKLFASLPNDDDEEENENEPEMLNDESVGDYSTGSR